MLAWLPRLNYLSGVNKNKKVIYTRESAVRQPLQS